MAKNPATDFDAKPNTSTRRESGVTVVSESTGGIVHIENRPSRGAFDGGAGVPFTPKITYTNSDPRNFEYSGKRGKR